jgi:hypothetical protein
MKMKYNSNYDNAFEGVFSIHMSCLKVLEPQIYMHILVLKNRKYNFKKCFKIMNIKVIGKLKMKKSEYSWCQSNVYFKCELFNVKSLRT